MSALTDWLTSIANAIRGKTGGTDPIPAADFADEIAGIETGGGDDADYIDMIQRGTNMPVLPESLTSIGTYAFYMWTNLALTSLPAAVASIGSNAFANCPNLAITSLPAELTSIGTYAFQACARLALTNLPVGLTTLGNGAFLGCSQIAITETPLGVASLGTNVFRDCTHLIQLSMPGVATIVGSSTVNGSFYQCTGLTDVTIGSAGHPVTSIGQYAFNGCANLTSIDVYTTGGVALANAPWGAVNADIIYHAA